MKALTKLSSKLFVKIIVKIIVKIKMILNSKMIHDRVKMPKEEEEKKRF